MKIHFKVFAFACLLFVWTNVFAMSCVDYCKANGWSDFSGLGFAYKWYGVAPGMGYDTGHSPEVGSVLVWKAWSKKDANGKEIGNPAGHVAIVASIVNNGEITVNHANWSPTGVTDGLEHRDVHVKDLSGGGWTRVSVYGSGSYETYGFIYSKNKSNSGTSLIRSAPLSNGRVYWRTKNLTDLSCENAQAWLVEDNDKAMSYETDASVCPKSCYSSSAMNVGLKWLNFFIKPTYARLNDCATTVSNVPSSDSSVPESSGPKPITGGTNSGTLPNLIPNNSDVENASKTKVTALHINEKGYCRMQTKNIGNKDAWPFQSKCWLSDGDKIDKHPKDLGKADTNKTLKPGKTNTEHEDFTAPEFPGKYNIVWCTDSAKQVKESNEGDNCHSEDPFTVWSNPNVVATSVTIIGNKTVLLPGEVYSVDTTIVNNGENFGKDIRVGWYLTGPGTGGVRVLLDTDNIKRENLKGGVSKVENLSARFAPETVGVYTLESCPDYDNRIAETNEGDNCKSMQFEVRIPPTIVYHPINAPLITSCPLPNDPDFNVMPTLPNGDVGATLFGNNKQRLFLPVATLAQAKTKLVWGGFSGFDPSLVTKICWNSEATYWGVDFSTACADGFVLQGNTWIADISNTPEASKGTWSFKQGTKDYWINPSTITDLPLDTGGSAGCDEKENTTTHNVELPLD